MKHTIKFTVILAFAVCCFTGLNAFAQNENASKNALTLIKNSDPEKRLQGYKALLADPKTATENKQTLLDGLDDRNENNALYLLGALEGMHDEKMESKIVSLLSKAQSEKLQLAALNAAQGYQSDKIKKAVVNSLLNTSAPVRQEAANTAAALKITAAVKPLKELITDMNKDVSYAAIGALGKIGGQDGEGALLSALALAEEPTLIAKILQAAASTKSAAFSELAKEKMKLFSNEYEVQKAGLSCITASKDRALCSFIDENFKPKDEGITSTYIYHAGLGKCVNMESRIISFLTSPDEKVRQASALALARINTKSSCKAVFDAMPAEKDKTTSELFFAAVTRCSPENKRKLLTDGAESKNENIRAMFAGYIASSSDDETIKLKNDLAKNSKFKDVKEKMGAK